MRKIISWLKYRNPVLFIAYVCVGIGLFVLGKFLYLINETYNISGKLTPEEMAQTGQVGDFIGGIVGSIWALAGVFLYFSAIRLQTKELSNQATSENENRYMEQIKQIENTFFNLLNAQQNIKQNLSHTFREIKYDGDKHFQRSLCTYCGNDFLDKAQRDLRLLYEFHLKEKYDLDSDKYLQNISLPCDKVTSQYVIKNILTNDIIQDIYITENAFKKVKEMKSELSKCKAIYFYFIVYYEPSIGHYCRHLYNILKYIDISKRDMFRVICQIYNKQEERKKKIEDLNKRIRCYISFLQSSLSTSEQIILFYNSLIYDKSRRLYIKYKILENLPDSLLFDKQHKTMISGYSFKSIQDLAKKIFNEE